MQDLYPSTDWQIPSGHPGQHPPPHTGISPLRDELFRSLSSFPLQFSSNANYLLPRLSFLDVTYIHSRPLWGAHGLVGVTNPTPATPSIHLPSPHGRPRPRQPGSPGPPISPELFFYWLFLPPIQSSPPLRWGSTLPPNAEWSPLQAELARPARTPLAGSSPARSPLRTPLSPRQCNFIRRPVLARPTAPIPTAPR